MVNSQDRGLKRDTIGNNVRDKINENTVNGNVSDGKENKDKNYNELKENVSKDNNSNRKHKSSHNIDKKNSNNDIDKSKLSDRIKQLEQEKKELEDLVKRIAADFDNYRKTVERERQILVKNSSRKIIEKILPVLDNLELALKDSKVDSSDPFVKGIELIYSQLLSLLEQEGLKQFNPLGQKFDPKTCEIILVKYDNTVEDMKIVDVVQKGYFLNDILIRPAKVIVTKRGEKNE